MTINDKQYEELRERCIAKYKKLYKDSVVFDACEVPKEVRLRLLEDEYYLKKTKAIKASLFENQLDTLDKVLAGTYQGEKATDQSSNILKALEMKNKILLDDLSVNKDESTALNVTFMAMSREDFEAFDNVEINKGSNNEAELGADFGVGDDSDSFEARMKKDVQDKLSKKTKNKED